VQPAGVLTLPVGGGLGEAGGLPDALGEVLGEVADVSAGFLGAAEDPLHVDLFPEPSHVRRVGQVLARLLERRQPGRARVTPALAVMWVLADPTGHLAFKI